jgi:hypothetical protein
MRQRTVARHQATAGVEQQHELLVLLVLVLARDQPSRARRRFPVDLAQAVADAVLAHLVEIGAFAASAAQVRADQTRGLVRAEHRELRQRREVREHAYGLRISGHARLPPQPQRRMQPQLHAIEAEISALVGAQVIVERGFLADLQRQPARQAVHAPATWMQVEHVHALAALALQVQRDGPLDADRPGVGHAAFDLRRRCAPQQRGVQ